MRKFIAAGILPICLLAGILTIAEAGAAPAKHYRSFSTQETRQLAKAGFSSESANWWLDALIRREAFVAQTRSERLVVVNFLIEWKNTGFTPEQAGEWDRVLASGIYWNEDPKTVKKLAAAGVTPGELSALAKRQLAKTGKTLSEACALQEKGLPLPPYVKLNDLAVWTAAGFSLNDAEIFLENRKRNGKLSIPLQTARAWKEAGFTAEETVGYCAVTKSTDTVRAGRIRALGISPADVAEDFMVIDNAKAKVKEKAAPQIDLQREYVFKPYFVYSTEQLRLQEFLLQLSRKDDTAESCLLESLHRGDVSYLKDPLKVKAGTSISLALPGGAEQLVQLRDVLSGHVIWTIRRALK